MNSPIRELQRLAADESVRISELLRKSLIVATKLELQEFRTWVECELKGYPQRKDVPKYRVFHCTYHFKNPYHGLCPIVFPSKELNDQLCLEHFPLPIQAVEHGIAEARNGKVIAFAVPPYIEGLLRKELDLMGMPVLRAFSSNSFVCILDAVRTRVLECALQLEAEGILGEGVMFTEEEKSKAQLGQSIHINTFQGILGNVSQSDINQEFAASVKQGDLESLLNAIRKLGATDEDLAELREALDIESTPPVGDGFGPRVSKWFGKMMGKAAAGGLQVGVGVSSAVMSAVVKNFYGLE